MAIDVSNIIKEERKQAVKQNESQANWFDFLNKDIKLFNRGLSDKKKERFYGELNILLTAGVDIRTALELIEQEQKSKKDQELFGNIRRSVEKGSGISESVMASGFFGPYEYNSLIIGEESGELTKVLDDLAEYFSKKIDQRRKITGALTYPAVIVTTAMGAMIFMMYFVVPMFADVLKQSGKELPAITQWVVSISNWVGNYLPYILLVIIGAAITLFTYRKSTFLRKVSAAVLLRIPVVGDLASKIYLARFCQSMNLLLSSGTTITSAIEMVEKMVGFYPIEVSLKTIQKDISRGESLMQSMSRFKIYNRRMISLIKVAEEVNQLDVIFGKLAKQYNDEVEHQTNIMSKLLEPVIMLLLGLVVGVILVAMYLPMFQLSTGIE